MFGSLAEPRSLVISEDDYIEFVAALSSDDPPVPPYVQERLTDSALMLLGFGLDDLDVRVLLRTLVGKNPALMDDYQHVAAQVDVNSSVIDPDRAKSYLEDYFKRVSQMQVYWGTIDDFTADLKRLKGPDR